MDALQLPAPLLSVYYEMLNIPQFRLMDEKMYSPWLPSRVKSQPVRYAIAAAFVLSFLLLTLHLSFGTYTPLTAKLTRQFAQRDLLRDVYNGTLGFEKVFAISLSERTDNRDSLVLATALSGFGVGFIDGVRKDNILPKVLPADFKHPTIDNSIAAWRAHMNTLQTIVHHNISSALILEDDIDWDVRLKPQLEDFARSSNALLIHGDGNEELYFDDLPPTPPPNTSPYGDGWDVLWLGHCGQKLPGHRGYRVVHENDSAVAQTQHYTTWDGKGGNPGGYANHTRVTSIHPVWSMCTLAYAVSQSGARKILHDIGLHQYGDTGAFDMMLRDWCDNLHTECFGVFPPLFSTHWRAGSTAADSDIHNGNADWREKAVTPNIRWSVRLNMKKLLIGDTEYEDQWPDA